MIDRLSELLGEAGSEKTGSTKGKYGYGKTPMQTFFEALHISKEKMIGYHPTDSVI